MRRTSVPAAEGRVCAAIVRGMVWLDSRGQGPLLKNSLPPPHRSARAASTAIDTVTGPAHARGVVFLVGPAILPVH